MTSHYSIGLVIYFFSAVEQHIILCSMTCMASVKKSCYYSNTSGIHTSMKRQIYHHVQYGYPEQFISTMRVRSSQSGFFPGEEMQCSSSKVGLG